MSNGFKVGVFDVDGTLVDDRGSVHPRAVNEIRGLVQEGVEIAVATARSPGGLRGVRAALATDLWAITCQGALIGRFIGDEFDVHMERTIDLRGAHSVVAAARKLGLSVNWYSGFSWYVEEITPVVELEAAIVGDVPWLVTALDQTTEPPHKLLCLSSVNDRQPLVDLARRLPGSVQSAYSHTNYLEIAPEGVSKGWALPALADAMGRSVGEMVTFGDGENDIPMFEVSGYSVAMAHSTESVRAAADLTAPEGPDGGLVEAIHLIDWNRA